MLREVYKQPNQRKNNWTEICAAAQRQSLEFESVQINGVLKQTEPPQNKSSLRKITEFTLHNKQFKITWHYLTQRHKTVYHIFLKEMTRNRRGHQYDTVAAISQDFKADIKLYLIT